MTLYGYLKSENGGYKISNWFFEQWLSGADFGHQQGSITIHEAESPKFAKVAEYFKDAANKIVLRIVLLILAALLAWLLGKELNLLDWLSKLK